MGTNTLTTIGNTTPVVAVGDLVDQYKTAITVDLVPRNSSGVPTAAAGELGSTLYPWGAMHADNILIDGNTISSVDTNGNIYITPNGAGSVLISKSTITTGTITTGNIATLNAAMNCSNYAMTNINVDSGAIDGTIIGANSSAAITGELINAKAGFLNTSVPLLYNHSAGCVEFQWGFNTKVPVATIQINDTLEVPHQYLIEVMVSCEANTGSANEMIFEKRIFYGMLLYENSLTQNGSVLSHEYDPGGRLSMALTAVGSNQQMALTATYTGLSMYVGQINMKIYYAQAGNAYTFSKV